MLGRHCALDGIDGGIAMLGRVLVIGFQLPVWLKLFRDLLHTQTFVI